MFPLNGLPSPPRSSRAIEDDLNTCDACQSSATTCVDARNRPDPASASLFSVATPCGVLTRPVPTDTGIPAACEPFTRPSRRWPT
jgi:hypothetical protein